MNTSDKNNIHSKDYIDKLIFEKNLRIRNLFFDKSLDLMLVVLSNKVVLKAKISDFPALASAPSAQLENWQLIGQGVGIHWPDLDEDISLRGLIKDYALSKALEKFEDTLFLD